VEFSGCFRRIFSKQTLEETSNISISHLVILKNSELGGFSGGLEQLDFRPFQVGGLWKTPGEDGRNGTLDAGCEMGYLYPNLLGPMNLFSECDLSGGSEFFERL